MKDQRSVDCRCCHHRLSREGKNLWSAVVDSGWPSVRVRNSLLTEFYVKATLQNQLLHCPTNLFCVEGNSLPWQMEVSWWLVCIKSWANLSMWSASALLVSMPKTPRMPNSHSCFTNGSKMSFRAKKLHSHAAQLTGGATAFLHRQKHPWNHLHEAQAHASLFGRAQAMRWANSHDETSLTGCLTTLFHQGFYWSPPPQGCSGHRRCWRALNIVRSDYNSPTWTKNLSRAELILCMITVFSCSRSVLKYSAWSDLAFN